MDERTKRIVRAIFGLKSTPPAGSQHHRSGWDDGLEAAIDVAKGAATQSTEQPATLADILRGAADRIDAEDLPQTAEDVADFCDGARWATAQLRRIAGETDAGPAGDATPDWLADLARRYATGLNSAERATLRFALELAEDQMLSRGNEFAAVDFAALESLKQRAGGEER